LPWLLIWKHALDLKIKRVSIGKVDFLRDIVDIKVYYDDPSQENWLQNNDPGPVLIGKDEPVDLSN